MLVEPDDWIIARTRTVPEGSDCARCITKRCFWSELETVDGSTVNQFSGPVDQFAPLSWETSIRHISVYLPEPLVYARLPSQAHTATSTPGLVNEICFLHS